MNLPISFQLCFSIQVPKKDFPKDYFKESRTFADDEYKTQVEDEISENRRKQISEKLTKLIKENFTTAELSGFKLDNDN